MFGCVAYVCFFWGLFGCVGMWVLLCAVCTNILGLLRVVQVCVHGGYFSLLWGGIAGHLFFILFL